MPIMLIAMYHKDFSAKKNSEVDGIEFGIGYLPLQHFLIFFLKQKMMMMILTIQGTNIPSRRPILGSEIKRENFNQ